VENDALREPLEDETSTDSRLRDWFETLASTLLALCRQHQRKSWIRAWCDRRRYEILASSQPICLDVGGCRIMIRCATVVVAIEQELQQKAQWTTLAFPSASVCHTLPHAATDVACASAFSPEPRPRLHVQSEVAAEYVNAELSWNTWPKPWSFFLILGLRCIRAWRIVSVRARGR
jgi:hypothetical protein